MDNLRRSLTYGFLATALLVLAAVTFLRSRPGDSVEPLLLPEVQTWNPDPAEIETQQALDLKLLVGVNQEPRDEPLLKALSSFNLVEMETGGDTSLVTYTKATGRYRVVVERFVRDYGMRRYVQLGLLQLHRFTLALDRLRSLAREEGITLSGIAAHHPDDEDLQVIRTLGGNFVDWALKQGLLVNDGSLGRSEAFLLGLLFKLRWLTWSKNMDPVDAHLTRFEKRTLLAYRVEVHPKMLLKRRLALIAELKLVDPGYPAEVMELLILIRHDRADIARQRVGLYLNRSPAADGGDGATVKQLRQIHRYLEHQAETSRR